MAASKHKFSTPSVLCPSTSSPAAAMPTKSLALALAS
eukprot:CAMPEP_0115451984 /NCGR_PEP_ID=MMETSP0271-20121206/42359_1 /TAXON_ID=71861 /ORGANISM="Scrippsiella trochoidea, Strain CCMP3099" /LENGTH=36 /DNA_ID= /DNA_START= /DNA_END= /DNA_ORIENTATION=